MKTSQVRTKADMEQSREPPHEVVSSVLSFYGSQLTSHASLIVGFIVAFFTLMQARSSIVDVGVPQWLFQVAAVGLVSAVLYSLFRVVLYGTLSGVLMASSGVTYAQFLDDLEEQRGRGQLIAHARVNEFANRQLKGAWMRNQFYKLRGHKSTEKSRRVTLWIQPAKRQVGFWIQPPMVISIIIATTIIAVMFCWVGDLWVWAEVVGSLSLGVALINLMSLRLARP